jgi:hypothetical protein
MSGFEAMQLLTRKPGFDLAIGILRLRVLFRTAKQTLS